MNARAVSAMIAQVVSPTREPNWTNRAGINPRAAPRRTVSAVITPGGAQKAIASMKDDKNSDIKFSENRPRQSSVYLSLLHIREIPSPQRTRLATTEYYLAVKIQHKFMWRGSQADGIHFVDTLVLDVFFKKVTSKYTTFEQKFMICFQCIQHLSK